MKNPTILRDQELRDEFIDLVTDRPPGSRPRSVVLGAAEDGPLYEFIREHGTQPLRDVMDHAVGNDSSVSRLAESIVKLFDRPALFVQDNTIVESLITLESAVWIQRMTRARERLERVIPAVGRINLSNHPQYQWVGTGWVIRDRIVVTNRHVAEAFCEFRAADHTFVFSTHPDDRRPVGARIDFRVEYDRPHEHDVKFQDVLYIEPSSGPDLAFLLLQESPGVEPIPLAVTPPGERAPVAVIGYPTRDSRERQWASMRQIFSDIYDVKRLSPGEVLRSTPNWFTHDCTTLGGNSGSAVIDLYTGQAVGLHFNGSRMVNCTPLGNVAIPVPLIMQRLAIL